MKLLLLWVGWMAAACAAAEPPVRYAEVMPLAAKSLLLDVAAMDSGYVAVGERGHVLLSADGEQWRQPGERAVPTRATLTAVAAVGRHLWAVGHDSVIIHSADGGQSWQRQFIDPDREQPLLDVWFDDENTGWAMGAYGLLLTTRDGGAHWEDVLLSEEYDYHLNAMTTLADGTRLIIAEAGNAWRRLPGESDWSLLELPYAGSMFSVLSVEGQRLVAMGLRGHVLESVDRGGEWYVARTGTEANLFGGSVGPDGSLVIVGAKGSILHRAAGQVDFRLHELDATGDLAAVLNLGAGELIVVGERGVKRIRLGDAPGSRP